MESITLVAPDISCNHCVATVQQAVGKIDGVSQVSANAESQQVDVTFDSQRTDRDAIVAALDAAGYPVSS